jgi:L-asparaginase II
MPFVCELPDRDSSMILGGAERKIMSRLIVEILRGNAVESEHEVNAVVLDSRAGLIASHGDPDALVFPRSSIKPIQALPFVLSGAHRQLPDPQKAIALACASHSAEDIHLEALRGWHERSGLKEDDLACGPQPPEDLMTWKHLMQRDVPPGRIHNNCSGKHTAMLATCVARGWPLAGYEKWDHPMQAEVRKHLSLFSGETHEQLEWAVDGCGIPTYRLKLASVARMMSVLLHPETVPGAEGRALREIREACAKEPYMISGHGGLCSEIIAATKGRVFAKVGAEGNYVALLYDTGVVIALKARDGAFRACEAALYALIERHGNLDQATLDAIRAHALPPVKNWSGLHVGARRIRFD